MRHINFFLGVQNGVFWVGGGGGQKVYVEKVDVLFQPPRDCNKIWPCDPPALSTMRAAKVLRNARNTFA